MYWILCEPTICRRYAKGTSGGLFSELLRFDEYLVIPFGLTNAPGQFQGDIKSVSLKYSTVFAKRTSTVALYTLSVITMNT